MPAYDSRSNPPSPFAFATIRNPDRNKSITDVPMLLDTGADVTLIPLLVSEALGIVPIEDQTRLVGFDGTISNSKRAKVEIAFLNKTFKGAYLIIDDTYGIIGRDILNLMSIHFDGPNLVWDELPK